MNPQIAPSILAADFVNLARDIEIVEKAGAKILHIDVMDGHFVPNLTVGPPVVRAIRRSTDLFLDVHLMITNPEQMAKAFVDAGADNVTVHYEAAAHLHQLMGQIREAGAEAGISLNPYTPVALLEEALGGCDLTLIMSVNPGFGGQEFIPTSFDKVRRLKNLIKLQGLNVKIEIDGGIGPNNTADAVKAGVDVLVAGSAIFGSGDPAATFKTMQETAELAAQDLISSGVEETT